jgi:hypothetical protein
VLVKKYLGYRPTSVVCRDASKVENAEEAQEAQEARSQPLLQNSSNNIKVISLTQLSIFKPRSFEPIKSQEFCLRK